MANTRFGLFQSPYNISNLVGKVYSYLPISSFPSMTALCYSIQSAKIQLSQLNQLNTETSILLQQQRMGHWFRYAEDCALQPSYFADCILAHPDFYERPLIYQLSAYALYNRLNNKTTELEKLDSYVAQQLSSEHIFADQDMLVFFKNVAYLLNANNRGKLLRQGLLYLATKKDRSLEDFFRHTQFVFSEEDILVVLNERWASIFDNLLIYEHFSRTIAALINRLSDAGKMSALISLLNYFNSLPQIDALASQQFIGMVIILNMVLHRIEVSELAKDTSQHTLFLLYECIMRFSRVENAYQDVLNNKVARVLKNLAYILQDTAVKKQVLDLYKDDNADKRLLNAVCWNMALQEKNFSNIKALLISDLELNLCHWNEWVEDNLIAYASEQCPPLGEAEIGQIIHLIMRKAIAVDSAKKALVFLSDRYATDSFKNVDAGLRWRLIRSALRCTLLVNDRLFLMECMEIELVTQLIPPYVKYNISLLTLSERAILFKSILAACVKNYSDSKIQGLLVLAESDLPIDVCEDGVRQVRGLIIANHKGMVASLDTAYSILALLAKNCLDLTIPSVLFDLMLNPELKEGVLVLLQAINTPQWAYRHWGTFLNIWSRIISDSSLQLDYRMDKFVVSYLASANRVHVNAYQEAMDIVLQMNSINHKFVTKILMSLTRLTLSPALINSCVKLIDKISSVLSNDTLAEIYMNIATHSTLPHDLIERCCLFIEVDLRNPVNYKVTTFALLERLLLQDELDALQADRLLNLMMLCIHSVSAETELSLKALRVWQRTGRVMPENVLDNQEVLDLLYSENSHVRANMGILINASWDFNSSALGLASDEAVLLAAIKDERCKIYPPVADSIPRQTYR